MSNTVNARLTLLALLFSGLMFVWAPELVSSEQFAQVLHGTDQEYADHLQLHILDVGQGDAVFIETPDGVQLLVDGGPDRMVLNRLGDHMSPLDRSIDMVIATHPHADHVGGLIDVLQRFTVDYILLTENSLPTQTAEQFLAAVVSEKEAGAHVWYARAGQMFALGASTTVQVLSPKYNPADMDADTSSVVIQVQYGDTTILLTGDAPAVIEELLVETYGSGLASNVLKLGHHGSRTSSAPVFLDAVNPDYAITSAGRDSRHGHPHEEVVARVRARDITHVSTQTMSTITFISDGDEIWNQR